MEIAMEVDGIKSRNTVYDLDGIVVRYMVELLEDHLEFCPCQKSSKICWTDSQFRWSDGDLSIRF